MESRALRKSLRALGNKANEEFPRLNWGGCCVFAAAVAKQLKKLGVEHEVIVCGSKDVNMNELRPPENTVSAWNGVGVSFGHVGVRLKIDGTWWTFDSEAFRRSKYHFGVKDYDPGYWTAMEGGITAKEATELANERRWNTSFYNQRNVKAVRRLVREHFNAAA